MKILAKVLSISLVFILFHCKNAEQTQTDGFKVLAVQKLGSDVEYTPNEDNSKMLCYVKKKGVNNSGYGVSFFVYDIKQKKVIYEDEIDRGTVSWHTEQELALFYTPGIMRNDQTRDDFTYIYNLDSERRTLKSDL